MINPVYLCAVALLCTVLRGHAADFNDNNNSLNGLLLVQAASADSVLTTSNANRIYGTVRTWDTLGRISKKFQTQGSMSQMIMSIFENNPLVFDEGNINLLKLNAMLEIPAGEFVKAKNHRLAYADLKKHNEVGQASSDLPSEKHKKNQGFQATNSVINGLKVATVVTPGSGINMIELPGIEETKAELPSQKRLETAAVGTPEPVVEPAPVVEKPVTTKRKKKKPARPLLRYSYDISIVDDSNIRKAQNDVDIRSDVITSITLKARGGKSLSSFSLLSYGASATFEAFNTFDSLNNINYNINTKFRFATSSGFTSPIYAAGFKLGGIESESEMRDATFFSAAFEFNKWVTNKIRMTAGLGYNLQESKSEVFDTVENRLFVNFDLNLSKTALLYGTYAFITGDTVSSASPTLQIINAADAIEPDDAFGGISTNQFAYRLDADTQVLTFGYNQIFTRTLSMDISAQLVATEAAGAITYDRSILRASLLGRF